MGLIALRKYANCTMRVRQVDSVVFAIVGLKRASDWAAGLKCQVKSYYEDFAFKEMIGQSPKFSPFRNIR